MKNHHSGLTKMRKHFISLFLLLFLLQTWFGLQVRGQAYEPVAEKIILFTDRTMFAGGEKILFTARLVDESTSGKSPLSQVLYLEIITPDGVHIGGGKYPLNNLTGRGCITIPPDIITGTYYLRAYTRFMRNRGPEAYAYIPLKIINPGKPDVLPGNPGNSTPSAVTGQVNKVYPLDPPTLELDKPVYSTRDSVRITIQGNRDTDEPSVLWCLSVVPAGSWSDTFVPWPMAKQVMKEGDFLPETRGISLSGRLNKPAIVNLSVPGEKECMAVRTDSAGRFLVGLPEYYGNKDLFICPTNEGGTKMTIRVDNDFCPQPVSLPTPEFDLDPLEKETALRLARNANVSEFFRKPVSMEKTIEVQPKRPFYDHPTEVLYFDKYIQLPTLEEYFSELPTPVKVRKKGGKKYFMFMGTQSGMAIYDPLVLIDWVAVDEVDDILGLPPQSILRIEFVNAPYLKGSMIYGGILSFISRQGDFAGINLPESGLFVNYGFYNDESCSSLTEQPSNDRPDARNTVFWKPGIILEPGKKAWETFTVPDTPGSYLVLLRGVTEEGVIIQSTATFEVSR